MPGGPLPHAAFWESQLSTLGHQLSWAQKNPARNLNPRGWFPEFGCLLGSAKYYGTLTKRTRKSDSNLENCPCRSLIAPL